VTKEARPRAFRAASYRFRATFGRRWGSYLSLVLLIGLVGGLAMGGLAAARRTQSSYSVYLASTNPSDVNLSIFGVSQDYSSALTTDFARLPHVHRVEAGIVLNGIPLASDGSPRLNTLGKVYPIASVNGLFFDINRVSVTQGRMADPSRPDEVMMPASAAALLGYHVGQRIPFGFYTNEQEQLANFGTTLVPPKLRIDARLVGLVGFSSEIVEDDIDRFPTFMVFTQGLAAEVQHNPNQTFSSSDTFGLQVDDGAHNVAAVEREVAHLIPPNTGFGVHATSSTSAKADRALKPIGFALGLFGIVALVAALLIATQAIARRLRESSNELAVLRALGANVSMTAADGLMGILGAVIVGSLLAAVVAVAISPVAPLGPVRSVYPTGGLSVDWAVLGLGLAVLIGALSSVALVLALRAAPHRAAQRTRMAPPRRSIIVERVSAAGLPAPGVVGVRMALESGSRSTTVPVRSALLGTALAVGLVVATVTFGSSLHSLVNTPALYGWNWTYMLNQVGSGSAGVPPQALTLLDHDPKVAAATGANYNDAQIDGLNVPFIFGDLNASLTPPILSGHALDQKNQIVLGAATMAELHKRLGDTVVMTFGSPADAPGYVPPTRLTIVGTATMPAVGFSSVVSDHTSMGTGALMSLQALPVALTGLQNSPYSTLDGPSLVFVRLRTSVPLDVGRADLQRIANAANRDFSLVPNGAGIGNTVVVQGVQRPAEIVDYRTIGVTPTLLASGLGLAAVTALALTLSASVRRRRRELALMKTIGFTRRQLAAAVIWHASVSAVVGIAIGVPLGVGLGRWLWDLFARLIFAVPEPTVPVWTVVLVAVGTIVLANLVAAVPARTAGKTSTALLLRAE
jgi:hypothetical protein